jgi:hypothetical protein
LQPTVFYQTLLEAAQPEGETGPIYRRASPRTNTIVTATKPTSVWVGLLLACLSPCAAIACKYTVRDVGFVDLGAPSYRLYLFVRDNTPKGLGAAFKQASYAVLLDSNVELDIVNVDRQKDHAAIRVLEDHGVTSYPAAILVSPQERTLELTVSMTGRTTKQAAWECLEGTVMSPIRTKIVRELVRAYCVVLLVEGTDAAKNAEAERAVTAAIKQVADVMDQMPKTTEKPPSLLRVPAKLVAQEELLLWALGLDVEGAGGPYAAVLYGRGRWIGPLFEDEAIGRYGLIDLLSLIGGSCECGLDRQAMLGRRLPLRWDQDAQTQSVRSLGFDPENPMVKLEVSQILSMGPVGRGDQAGIGGLLGYSEQVIEFASDPEEAAAARSAPQKGSRASRPTPTSIPSTTGAIRPAPQSKVLMPKAPTPVQPPPQDAVAVPATGLGMTWIVVAGLALVILVGGVFVILRAQRRAA